MTSKRIGMSLFDDELKSLINASAKIFPVSEEDILNNLNPNNYEYVKVGRKIYVWQDNIWQYVIADDVEILWGDIQDKPTSYTPSTHVHNESDIGNLDKYTKFEVDTKLLGKSDTTHNHSDLHNHTNKTVLDIISQTLIDTWNTVTGKADVGHKHTKVDVTDFVHTHTEIDITNLDKYTKSEIDTKLLGKSDTTHNHDGAYYKKGEIDTKLGGKADKVHTHTESEITDLDKYTKSEVDTRLLGKSDNTHGHTDLHTHTNKALLDKLKETTVNTDYDISDLKYIADIRAGYTEGHSHTNKSVLDTITQLLIDGWNSAVTHISDTIKHITSEERTLWNTVSSKSDDGHTHPYAPSVHAHDDVYYTETEVNTLLGEKSDTTHNHNANYYTESEINTMMSGKADNTTLSGHTGNTIVHITQLDKNAWYGKQDALGFTPVNTTDSRLSDARTPTAHTHTKSNIIDFAHTHTRANITDFAHTHTKANITDFPASLPANGGNADTVGGLHVNNTGVNNIANQIARTDGNASLMTGWINTTSGVASGAPTRIYCSQDAYLRYYDPATFKTQLGLVDSATNKTLWIGAEGSRGSDANTIYFCY